MAKIALTDCDKMVRRALSAHGCQTSHQLKTYSNRVFNEDYSVGSISAALRKLVQKGMAAYSENEKSQKVYWLTEYGFEKIKEEL
jgi:DNA-binding PadR family transcriptional regulator